MARLFIYYLFFGLILAASSCAKCDLTDEADTEHFPSEDFFVWLPDSMGSNVSFSTLTGYTDSWTPVSSAPVTDSFYSFCSGRKIIRSYYKRYSFFSVLNGDFEIELQGNSEGTQLFLFLNGRSVLYNFDTNTPSAINGFTSTFFYYDSYPTGSQLWTGVYEIGLVEDTRKFDDNDPVKIFISKRHGLIGFELKNGLVWSRT